MTVNVDQDLYLTAQRRITWMTVVLAAGGTVVCAILSGVPGALGFATGSFFSWANFRLIKRIVDSVGKPAQGRRGAAFAVFLGLRYAVLGAAGYVILKYFGVNLLAVLAGLLAVVAAVILEAIYQLITYAGT